LQSIGGVLQRVGRDAGRAFEVECWHCVLVRCPGLKLKFILSVVFCHLFAGCATVASNPRPANERLINSVETDERVVRADSSPLSDERINQLMRYRYQAPQSMRVALMSLGGAGSLGRSEKLLYVSDEFKRRVIDKLMQSSRIYDVSFLPSFLVTGAVNQSDLRLAAATYQADLLLLYSYQCRSFGRNRLFSKSQQNAYCSVEGAALDTRSGTIPFTAVSVNEFSSSQDSNENSYELRLKAEADAITQGMSEIVESLETHITAN